MAELPFASAEGLKKVIDHLNRQTERINALSMISVEMAKLLIESGALDREKYLVMLELISNTQESRDSEHGALLTKLMKGMIETQTGEKQSGKD